MYRKLEKTAINIVQKAIQDLGWEEPAEIKFEVPPNPNMGDLATSVAFQFAPILKRSPVEISQTLVEKIELISPFKGVESKGPYVNFFFDTEIFSRMVTESVQEDYGSLEKRDEKVILEHTSANPNGPLHIGHVRNAIIGDSLARVLRAAGFQVETQYYVNDMGRQIAMIVWGLQNLDYQMDPDGKGDVEIGKLYFEVNQELKANPEIKQQIDTILKIYEEENPPELESMFKEVVSKCLEGVENTSRRMNITHDAFIWESKFVRDGSLMKILNKLEDYTSKNEVLYLDLNNYGIEKELILTRSDGTSLYTTRDLAYHLEKSENSDIVVDVLGSDHKLAIDQLKVALGLLGGKSPEVVFYEFITLPEGSMSTRRGVFISVDELIDEATQRARAELDKRRPELSEDEKENIAKIIGVGAIRYYIARLSPEKHIVFKWDEALSFERGCASIQYAHARACKLLGKANGFTPVEVDVDALNFQDLDTLEVDLLKTLARFSSIVTASSQDMRVHSVAQYALEVAGAFNKFYKSVPVIGSEKEVLRLLLVDKSRITIRNCLDLLGIESPVSM
ncbi:MULTISPECIES: arginine--tRNA ligase [Methanobacterium]|jgi:arginyl-tRNA synthetase|uniref:Arginine--tRNA ligase n=1 Tax=Methanobacterium subterraneum TaxID=59277 RepID=A0A2H4VAV2_9EURY|nr:MULTISPECIES: arginine--tRNA ligase [Methanobacterium]MBW4256367.1 arginine--tRNA ligase [Methanobacterium sp. YSL]PKL72955.1 MAG: arginine--tRNA ligase [Methanobacteriales archaeon HGW-Methanobacteriales-2]AUB55224.1 arginine--tRNA ligase [Methanobacterium subterraneum]AUB57788.1 arginine--tRNA ligase [Methanobacterium sp. MZ-A1]NMO09986.1 arginine--tRNA ligase [Methanobacterium subterraneum]